MKHFPTNTRLKEDDIQTLILYARERLSRNNKIYPLYVLLCADEMLQNNTNENRLDISTAIENYLSREDRLWREKITEENTLCALKNLMIYSTIVGECDLSEQLPDFLVNSQNIVSISTRYESSKLKEWCNILTGHYEERCGHIIMPPLEPDLMGEKYVLRLLNFLPREAKDEWCNLFFTKQKESYGFFYHCLVDFYDCNDAESQEAINYFMDYLCKFLVNNRGKINKNTHYIISRYSYIILEKMKQVAVLRNEALINKIREVIDIYWNDIEYWAVLRICYCDILNIDDRLGFIDYCKLWFRFTDSSIIFNKMIELLKVDLKRDNKQLLIIKKYIQMEETPFSMISIAYTDGPLIGQTIEEMLIASLDNIGLLLVSNNVKRNVLAGKSESEICKAIKIRYVTEFERIIRIKMELKNTDAILFSIDNLLRIICEKEYDKNGVSIVLKGCEQLFVSLYTLLTKKNIKKLGIKCLKKRDIGKLIKRLVASKEHVLIMKCYLSLNVYAGRVESLRKNHPEIINEKEYLEIHKKISSLELVLAKELGYI